MFLYNTLTREKEEFKSIKDGYVGMYTCGPTVYDYAHIGNFRTYIFEDLLRRYLKYKDYQVKQVMNITDIDDKTIKKSNEEGVPLHEITEKYINAFYKDLDELRIERAEVYPRATEHIEEMIELILRLEKNGLTYKSDDGIYFPITEFEDYGKLSGFDISEVKSGARVSQDEYSKEDARDFALWKFERPNEPSWDAPFGRGRPGWSIECSAMSMNYLGETFDIHTGGVDNIFPHHENEIAQSEGATGKKFVNYWLHSEHLLIDGRRMAKSMGNFYTLNDLLKLEKNPVAIRYLLISKHYRKQLNFTIDGVDGALSTLQRVWDLRDKLNRIINEGDITGEEDNEIISYINQAKNSFEEYMDDDLSISPALGSVFDLVKELNIRIDEGLLNPLEAKVADKYFDDIDEVLDVFTPLEITSEIPDKIIEMAEERKRARKNNDYELADKIRDKIMDEGYNIKDTKDGYRITRRN